MTMGPRKVEMQADSGKLDQLARDLQELRRQAGNPSYADIVARIGRQRRTDGGPAGSRPGRTTVYDAFRTGRRRVDADLVVEIARALGVEEAEAARWATRCREAMAAEPDVTPDEPPAAIERERRRLPMSLVMPLCVLVNLAGRGAVELLQLPLHLDMIGTVVAAVLLGPWWGALVGAGTNVAGMAISGPESLAFVPVNVVGALVWGYGVRYGWGRSVGRFLVLSAGVGVASTLVAVPIVLLVFDGYTQHAEDALTLTAFDLVHHLALAVFISNLITSLADKVVSGFIGLAVVESLGGAPERR